MIASSEVRKRDQKKTGRFHRSEKRSLKILQRCNVYISPPPPPPPSPAPPPDKGVEIPSPNHLLLVLLLLFLLLLQIALQTSLHYQYSLMYKFKRSQILLPFLASLLIVTPLLSSSLRPTYLYFIINLLIIALGAESGLLSSLLSNPNPSSDDTKLHVSPTPPTNGPSHDVSADRDNNNVIVQDKRPNKVVEKCNSEKIAGGGGGLKATIARVKKCPSTPSIFFIGGGETQSPEAAREESEGEELVEGEEEELAGISSQELFTKAENFIGNFYNQLKMQREESWKKIHGFYQKSF